MQHQNNLGAIELFHFEFWTALYVPYCFHPPPGPNAPIEKDPQRAFFTPWAGEGERGLALWAGLDLTFPISKPKHVFDLQWALKMPDGSRCHRHRPTHREVSCGICWQSACRCPVFFVFCGDLSCVWFCTECVVHFAQNFFRPNGPGLGLYCFLESS